VDTFVFWGKTFLPKFTQHTDNTDNHGICVGIVIDAVTVTVVVSVAVAISNAVAVANHHFFQEPFS
jgi:hypothetical protein